MSSRYLTNGIYGMSKQEVSSERTQPNRTEIVMNANRMRLASPLINGAVNAVKIWLKCKA